MRTLRLPFLFALLIGLAPTAAWAQASLFADLKARQPGELLTVVLAERTSASRQSEWENASDAQMGGQGQATSPSLSGSFGLDATFSKSSQSRNESVQRDLLTGTMTVRVTEVDEAGNLVVAGERRLSVNGEMHSLEISGLVRPYDIAQDNSILSWQIAGATIEYEREGGIKRRLFKPGRLVRIGLIGIIAAAVALGGAAAAGS